MNSIDPAPVYFRSLATRTAGTVVPDGIDDIVAAAKAWGADLVIVETPGIGQGDAAIVDHVDLSLYVMTPEFGAASQLEKIDMLDFADVVAINKFDRRGGEDALRDVRRQLVRNTEAFGTAPDDMPVFGTVASRFNDDGVTGLYQELRTRLAEHGLPGPAGGGVLAPVDTKVSSADTAIVPPARARYLADIAEAVRDHHAKVAEQAAVGPRAPAGPRRCASWSSRTGGDADAAKLPELEADGRPTASSAEARGLLDDWPASRGGLLRRRARRRDPRPRARTPSSPRSRCRARKIPRVALPRFTDHGELLRFLMLENLPGRFPFTAGVFPFKRDGERPARMFAGEGDAFRTNRRFHLLSEGQPATRLSTAFDSVTLYGFDPDLRPDIYGKVGNSGVCIATLDDMKVLFDGFDLCDPSTSVSMTINGPAPTILAMFLNTAIDQRLDALRGRARPRAHRRRGRRDPGLGAGQRAGHRAGRHPQGGPGPEHLHLLHRVRPRDDGRHRRVVRGRAGAQLLQRVDLRLPHRRSGREPHQPAGLHPRQRLHLRRGLPGPGHGHRRLRPQPLVLLLQRHGPRVHGARPGGPPHLGRRHAGPLRRRRAQPEAQVPRADSGRSLHAQEMAFNDIRTTLQALIAIYDNCNSLHTNAYDEAVTTPTAESVRRALAIQLVINEEWGLAMNENPNQGSFIIDELTDLVEAAVLAEFDRIAERGGVLGAMETGYQRGRIQDESLLYETRKHDGTLPLIGVNTFLPPAAEARRRRARRDRAASAPPTTRSRASSRRLADFQARHAAERPAALAPPPGRRPRRRQPVRGADGRRPLLLPRRDHPHPLRGRRPLPPQRLTRRPPSRVARGLESGGMSDRVRCAAPCWAS